MDERVVAPVPLELAIRLEHARHRLVKELDRDLWKVDMTFASMRALLVVTDARGLIHAGEVSRRMGVSRQAAAVLLKRLTAMGAVEVVDEGWARSVRVTDPGRRLVEDCVGVTGRTLSSFARLGAVERRDLGRLLRKTEGGLELLGSPW
jgi:DNA-binding MarR family transcriptional regulator